MGEKTSKDLYIQFYNADMGRNEWLKFDPAEVDSLMDLGILDTDTLGYFMQDKDAFDKALDSISKAPGPMNYGQFVSEYLKTADSDIRITA